MASVELDYRLIALIDRCCDEYESNWTPQRRLEFGQILASSPEGIRRRLFTELLALEISLARSHGLTVDRAEVELHYPTFADLFDEARALGEPTVDIPLASHSASTFQESPLLGNRFQVKGPLGRGGLGVVTEATDTELDRRVAIKQVRSDYADNPLARARLMNEARLTAELEHPAIVPILGRGSDANGRPYYAMRLIQGRRLSEVVREFHALEATADRELSLRDLLQRFIAVCEAIDYAHGHHIIHRDIKPTNIMVGQYGETLVIDWGLAKYLREGDELEPSPEESVSRMSNIVDTLTGQAVGTVGYMSPEQASGNWAAVGPKSDVFSLGRTLEFILTGESPAHRVSTDRDNDLRSVSRRLRRPERKSRELKDLLAIVARATAADSQDRYATAAEVANDVKRWLADEPVTARQESRLEKCSRWRRKNPRWSLAISLAVPLFILATTLGYSRWQVAAARERMGFEQAFRAYSNQLRLVRTATSVISLSSNSDGQSAYMNDPNGVGGRLLEGLTNEFSEVVKQHPMSSENPLTLGQAHVSLGELLQQQSRWDEAVSSFQRALVAFSEASPRTPALSTLELQASVRLAQSLLKVNRHTEAKKLLAKVEERSQVGSNHSLHDRVYYMIAWQQLGEILADSDDDHTRASGYLRKAISTGDGLFQQISEEDDDGWLLLNVTLAYCDSYISLARAMRATAPDETLKSVRAILAFSPHRTLSQDLRDTVNSTHATILFELAKHSERFAMKGKTAAEDEQLAKDLAQLNLECCHRAIEIASDLAHRKPQIVSYKLLVADLYANLATIEWFGKISKPLEARQHMQRAVEIGESNLWPGDHSYRDRVAYYLGFVGQTYGDPHESTTPEYQKTLQEQRTWYERAVAVDDDRDRPGAPTGDRLILWYRLASCQAKLKERDRAIQIYRRILDAGEHISDQDDLYNEYLAIRLGACEDLTRIYKATGAKSEQLAVARQTVETAEKLVAMNTAYLPNLLTARIDLAEAQYSPTNAIKSLRGLFGGSNTKEGTSDSSHETEAPSQTDK